MFKGTKKRRLYKNIMRRKAITMSDMTEEEAFALDEKWTKTTPKVGPNGSGFLSKRKDAQSREQEARWLNRKRR